MNSTIDKQLKLIATYSRVSENPDEEERTIKNQLMTFAEQAEKNNWQIVQEYKDDDWSGDILERPSLDRLRLDAKNKNRAWEAVLIYDPDRLARRYSYQELVMDELREAGVEIMFVTVSAPKNSEDKILHGVRGLFAEYERAKITERFRLGKLRKVKEGHVLTTEAPYGYRYIRNNKETKKHGYYVIEEEEAKVVKMIFSWVANDGLTLRTIVRKLQEMGITPRKSKRGVWSTSTLSHLLRHRAYVGETHWGSSYAVVPEKPRNHEKYKKMKKSSRRIRPEQEWITIPVPAIIEPELFKKAGQQLKTNFALCQRNKKNEYLLSGVVECVCGRKRAGEGPQHGKHLYYRCTDRVYSFPLAPTCREKGVNARIADKLVWGKIADLMSSPKLLAEQVDRWFNSKQNENKAAIVDVEALKKETEKLRAQVERYNKGYGAGAFILEQLKEYTTPMREKISQLELQIANTAKESSNVQLQTPSQAEMTLFAEKAKKTLHDLKFPAQRAIVLNVVEKVIGTKEHLQVIGNIPINQNVEFFPFNRDCRIAERREINTVQCHHQKQG
jgi:site-specific DNA recombinase